MGVEDRLAEYYSWFDEDVIETVAETVEWQKSLGGYHQLFDKMGIPDLGQLKKDGILDIRPKEYDPTEALVYHLPMANPLDANQVYQAAAIANTNPNKRLIAAANPSGPGYGANTLSWSQLRRVKHGDFRPATDPLLSYLDRKAITRADHIGYSYGSETAAAAIANGLQEVERAVMIEPASVVKRGLVELGAAFNSARSELEHCVEASDSLAYTQAHKDGVSLVEYGLGLLRPSNVAIARGLAKGKFEQNLDTALKAQTEMIVTVITGDESELALKGAVREIVTRLRHKNGLDRLVHLTLPGQKHAMASDIYLQAALVLEGLK